MDAFWKLYKKGGISKVSVTKICELAGYNRSTFYMYFQDIDQVLEEIESQVITPDEFNEVVLSNILAGDNKKEAFQMLVALYEENEEYLPILLGEYGDPGFREKLLKKLAPAVSMALNLPLYENKKMKYIMEYQSAAVLTMISKWYQNKKDISVDELIHILLDVTTNGVQAELLKCVSRK